MGVLNNTPDSFSDGGHYYQAPKKALARAHQMIAEGADIIDIGGESTRPGATPVSCEEELTRVIPLIKQLRAETDICISIDTTKPEVMQAAVSVGASMINDISALASPGALETAVTLAKPVCLMHMQNDPQTMQYNPSYPQGVIVAIQQFFQQQIERCLAAGMKKTHLLLDPGFGFGKSPTHNLQMVKELACFHQYQLPLLLGVSRKSTLGYVTNKPVDERLAAGLTLTVLAWLQGVSIIRTHDVGATYQALQMFTAVQTVN